MSESATPQRPTAGGMYDYYLGGTENTPADRIAAEQIIRQIPAVRDTAWANRGFLQRAVRKMASSWGIRQFIDIGAGLPTQRNTHQVVAEVVDDGRVVYVDNDPTVVARGNALLAEAAATTGNGAAAVTRTAQIEGDLRQPETILDHPVTRRLIDFDEPVGLLMVAVMHFVPDADDPWGLVKQYVDRIPSGSYLALSHTSGEQIMLPDQARAEIRRIYAQTATPPRIRKRHEVHRFFRGLVIVPPYAGAPPEVTFVGLWDAEDPQAADSEGARWIYAAVGRKP